MSTNSTKRMEDSKQSRYPLLINWFKSRNCKVIVALSGGVDSALVTLAARQALGKENVLAITANYQTLANEELETAKKVAKEIDVIHHLLEYNELDNPNFTKNDSLRCFHCRNELAINLLKVAKEKNISLIVDGTNLDDVDDDRPGMIALHSMGIKSPLLDIGLGKKEVRHFAKINNLSVHDKPSNSCLASRVPHGTEINSVKLRRIERCEMIIKKLSGVRQVRVRDHDTIARIEIERSEISKLCNLDKIDKIVFEIRELGFKHVTLDLEGYGKKEIGKLNEDEIITIDKYVKK
ncbi:tRNA-specific 2-thiouridylase MnmA [Candidatus Nitrosocosmicus oleophilus]|uniref:tRNA-specific 2-thiouridylase MnmA n=1 Tax=Candidatus Nitrosocosmicus oleophilus TaxID=1353260 RepID=A0A654M0B8_9ARCH|nr:ATP-dependent sacrificial sulfur transferase LarE [Candidatus Nitrosocosmicus oleophilus]ALI36146.1 tRNA-specific 2-thiouridylase MnmA [Candidatus Nitrosocosmicus oleophilus]